MGHRHVSNSFMISGLDQHDTNHLLAEQSCIPMVRTVAMENGPFVVPMHHMSRGGVHSDSRWDSGGGSNEHRSSNVSLEVQHFPPAFARPPVDPYPHLSITGNTSLTPMTPVGHVHTSHYNVPSIRDFEGGVLNSLTGNGAPFKRKSPGISESGEGGSSSCFYGAGSSSSSQMLMEKPAVDRCSLPPYRGASLTIAGEDSMRNVRSRSRLGLEPSMTRTHVPGYSSHYYQATTHSENYSAPVHPVSLNADTSSGEWNSVPHYVASSHGRISPPDINSLRHETTQFYAGGSSVDIDACHRDSFFNRNPVSSSQHPYASHAQSMRDGHSNHPRRVTSSYRNGPSYSYYAHGGSSSTNESQFPSENFSSGYSRHSSAGGWRSGYRSGRPRIAVERLQPIVDVMDYHDRLGHETITTVDRASFYGSSRNLLDQYRDMRLDIDSMSYEELLALEERIGDVSTGLSEDSMSNCLREQEYCSMDQNHEEVTCPICLEGYKNGEKVGTMEKCGHDYHVDCIKKWLLMKKVCPICKSECSSREPTQA